MADPDHVAVLDGFDRLTVPLYRAGLGFVALGMWLAAAGWLGASDRLAQYGELVTVGGIALSCANMHLYDKVIRWVIAGAAWAGLWLHGLSDDAFGRAAALGFAFVALSGLALKEQFCFRIPFLRAVPPLLALSLVPILAGVPLAVGVLLAAAGALVGVLAVAKLRQPLHYDIGDKSRYQI